MTALERTRMTIVALSCAVLGVTVVADTGSPPPPVIIQGVPSPATKAQLKAYTEVVKPTYLASISDGAISDSYPAFTLFVGLYPCSTLDRMAYLSLYLLEQQPVAAAAD